MITLPWSAIYLGLSFAFLVGLILGGTWGHRGEEGSR